MLSWESFLFNQEQSVIIIIIIMQDVYKCLLSYFIVLENLGPIIESQVLQILKTGNFSMLILGFLY